MHELKAQLLVESDVRLVIGFDIGVASQLGRLAQLESATASFHNRALTSSHTARINALPRPLPCLPSATASTKTCRPTSDSSGDHADPDMASC